MAHGLKYYKEIVHTDGKVIRLEILEKDYVGIALEIGPVCQALCLDIQGDTEIDAPIVKTSLTMTFVDAPDHEDSDEKKCGDWSEFYTNDATYWQIVVKAKNAGETAFRSVWGGYVTPDSYNEILVYRGSVTIVARDNIGHLADFPFDAVGNADGMISLIELIREAWAKIESPMILDDQAVANADWLISEGSYAYDTYMNVSAFADMNWYDALESALYGYGLTLRYTGWNNVSFYSLRNLPRLGAYELDDIDYREPLFVAGAERELTPAVRRIEESVEYELTDSKSAPMAKSIKFVGSTSTIPFESKNMFDEKEWKNIDVWPITNTSGLGWGNGADSNPLYFNPAGYPCEQSIKDDAKNSIYLATNTDNSGAVWYAQMFRGKRFNFTMTFGRLVARDIAIASKPTVMPTFNPDLTIKKVKISVAATSNGVSKYMTEKGEWQTDGVIFEIAIDEDSRQASKTVYLDSLSEDDCLVVIAIHGITLGGKGGADWYDSSKGGGIYVALQSLTFAEAHGDALCETNRVNTNYDQTNNVILSRNPKIAPALDDVLFPSIIKNGIFVKVGNTYHPAKLWNWGGQTPQQMAVYNHLQLLCYHAKPNNILRGTIVNADVTDMQVIWMWHGAEHMFVSGSFNLLSGHIENAVLREFARYEDMWGILDEAHLPQVDGSSVTNVESGSASKNEGARNTINTEVYLGGGNIVLDDYMSDTSENGVMNRVIKAYVDNLWHLDENGNLVTDKQVLIKNNLIIDGDTSSGGEGEDTPSGGISGVKVNGVTYYDDNGDGVIDLGTISGGGGTADLSNYYTKAQSDAKYLALSGGTISGSERGLLNLNSSDYLGPYITFATEGTIKAYIGYDTNAGAFFETPNEHLFLRSSNAYFKAGSSEYTLIHSGNIGSYKAGDSALFDGRTSGEYYLSQKNGIPNGDLANLAAGSYYAASARGDINPLPIDYCSLSVLGRSYYSQQLCMYHNATRAWLRGIYNTSSGVSATEWHELAFLDSNVSSATKLQNARTIWGIPFDGTNIVAGSLHSNLGYYGLSIVSEGGSPESWYGVKTFMTWDEGSTMGACRIGTSYRYQGLTIGFSTGHPYDHTIPNGYSYWEAVCIQRNGNVGIGTTSPSYKLDVYGDSRINGNLIVSGDVASA